jgi:DNA-binding CsgD family transcriptional regulator
MLAGSDWRGAEQVTTAAVRASTPTRFGRLTSPVLIGREQELQLLLDAAAAPPAVAIVEGEAGVGKTRLVEEFLARPELADRISYVGRCHQLSEPFPLGPVLEALRRATPDPAALAPVAGALRPVLPELEEILPPAPESLADKRAERHRLFRALRDLIGALGPSVLVLEDLHWADQATSELLRFLIADLPPTTVLVCTYRSEDVPDGSPLLALAARLPGNVACARVVLQPLDQAQVRDLVSEILESDSISDEFAGYLFERSAGLPFAVEEVLLLLKERKGLVHRSGVWVRRELEELGVPRAFRDSILQRMAGLGVGARTVVQAAAVLGEPTAEEVILEIVELSGRTKPDALVEALSSALLFEVSDGIYGFRHPLARQAVEDAVPPPLRRRLHRRAARALATERPQPLSRLAHHYRQAGDTKTWIRYAEAAADRAVSLEDDATAYAFLRDAVSVPSISQATRTRLAAKLATHALHCSEHDDAIGILQQLLDDHSLPRGTRGELRLRLGSLLHHAGETTAAFEQVAQALEDLGRKPALAAEAMAFLARPWAPEGRIDQHLDWLDRALSTIESSNDQKAKMRVAVDRAVALLTCGDPRAWDAIGAIPRPGSTAEERKRAVAAHTNLSSAAIKTGHYRQADEFISTGLALAAEIAYTHGATFLKMNKLELDWLVGSWEGLEQDARRYAEVTDRAQDRAHAQAVLGLLLLASGEVSKAIRVIEPLAGDFHGMVPAWTWVTAALARIRLAQGNADAAVDEAAKGLNAIAHKNMWAWAADAAPTAVETLLAAQRPAEAIDLTHRFAAGLRGRDAPAAAAALAVCQGLVAEAGGDRRHAVRAYLAGERAWAMLPRPYEAIRARESAGRCLLEESPERGHELLVHAMDAFRELGAAWDAARIRRTLREHGLVAPHRRGRKGYGGRLSPREAQVAALARDGLTNREIALKLFLSPKTVDRHLTSAMRKLKVTSRTELPSVLEMVEAVPDAS